MTGRLQLAADAAAREIDLTHYVMAKCLGKTPLARGFVLGVCARGAEFSSSGDANAGGANPNGDGANPSAGDASPSDGGAIAPVRA